MPASRWPYLEHPGPIAFAHRGGAAEQPENTMVAFEHAIDLGYRYLETDVQVTADGVALAFHDAVLDRVTDRPGVVAELPWREVAAARVNGDHPIPLLEDVLGSWPDARVNIDLKAPAALEPLVDALRRTRSYERVCVASFSDRRLARFRRTTGGQVCTALGPSQVARLLAAGRRLPSGAIGAQCAQVPVLYGRVRIVDERFLAVARERGMPVHVWTVDEAAAMHRLLDLGVDGIMTDRPTLLREVLIERGQWA